MFLKHQCIYTFSKMRFYINETHENPIQYDNENKDVSCALIIHIKLKQSIVKCRRSQILVHLSSVRFLSHLILQGAI